MKRFALLSLVLFPLAGELHAQPAHDECAGAIPIRGFGEFAFDTTNATASPELSSGCAHDLGVGEGFAADVWFAWDPDVPGINFAVTIDTCGMTTVDTRLAVYEGSCEDLPLPVSCDDDGCLYQSRIITEVYGSYTHLIRVGSSPGLGGGSGVLRITRGLPAEGPYPSLLGCPSAAEPTPQAAFETCNARDRFDAVNSTRTHFTVTDDFVPDTDGVLRGVCWSGTYLRDGDPCQRGIADFFELTYYADDCGAPGEVIAGPFSQEDFTMEVFGQIETHASYPNGALEYQYSAFHDYVPVERERTYWIGLTNSLYDNCSWYWGLASGHDGYALQIDQNDGSVTPLRSDLAFCSRIVESDGPVCEDHPPPNDDCADAIALFGDSIVAFDTYGASTDGPYNQPYYGPPGRARCEFPLGDGQVHRDVWYRYDARCESTLRVSVCDSDFDTKLAVYAGTACTPYEIAVACADDGCGVGEFARQSELLFDAAPDTIYQIRVGGYAGAWGRGTLTVESSAPRETDLSDFAFFSNCVSGSAESCCVVQDYNADGDVGADDYSAFYATFVGP